MITADLKSRTVLVTGGASGIGLAAVELFAKCGAVVAMNHLADDSRGPAEIERLIGAGLDVVSAPGDVSVPGEAERMVESTIRKLGGSTFSSTMPARRPPPHRSSSPISTP